MQLPIGFALCNCELRTARIQPKPDTMCKSSGDDGTGNGEETIVLNPTGPVKRLHACMPGNMFTF